MSTPLHIPALGKDDVFIVPTLDGSDTLFSNFFHSTYHSLNGAVSESRHVFIQHGLVSQQERNSISILEFGFGTGLNAFLSYLFSKKNNKKISYIGIECYPIDISVARELNYPSYLAVETSRPVFERMHSMDTFNDEIFHFQKLKTIEDLGPEHVDCIFFDAFAPAIQPEHWEENIFDRLFAMISPGGCLVTYCAQGELRRKLQRTGYQVNRLPGAPGKREMIQAIKH